MFSLIPRRWHLCVLLLATFWYICVVIHCSVFSSSFFLACLPLDSDYYELTFHSLYSELSIHHGSWCIDVIKLN
jgi:hypothetical protein